MSSSTSPTAPEPHWVVNVNRRSRVLAFIAVFLTIASHIWIQHSSWWLFPGLVASFLIWPHLAYLRARRSPDSINAEFDNLIIDAVIFGIWISGLGFPVWIAFILSISTSINLMVYRRPRGLAQSLMGLACGIALGTLAVGVHLQPDTHGITTGIAIISISLYLMLVGHISYTRNQILHDARERQRLIENELKQRIEENQLLQARLQEQANRDPLTGLYNRRYLDDSLQREIDRCCRVGSPTSLVLMDIDHFKPINDTHGHVAGDAVLSQLAAILGSLSRNSDILCRFGGEEFLVVLPDTSLEIALKRAEEYRQAIENTPMVTEKGPLSITLSAGVASFTDCVEGDSLIHMADKALYQAKEQGRNRVVAWQPDVSVPAWNSG